MTMSRVGDARCSIPVLTDDSKGLQAAFSPSYASMVQIKNDGKLKWRSPEYQLGGDIGSSMEDGMTAVTRLSVHRLTIT